MATDKYERAAYFARFAKNNNIEPLALAELCRLADKVCRAATLVANAGVAVKNGCGRFEHQIEALKRADQSLHKARLQFDTSARHNGYRTDHTTGPRPCIVRVVGARGIDLIRDPLTLPLL